MPDAAGYVAGKEGFVLVTNRAFPFDEWGLDFGASNFHDVSNWLTTPYPWAVPGIHRAALKLKMPFVVSFPLVNLNSYVFNLGYYTGVYLTGTFLIKLSFTNKTDGNPTVDVTGTPLGALSITAPV